MREAQHSVAGKSPSRSVATPHSSRHGRKPTWSDSNPEGRWRVYDYDELMKRDKANLDLFWLRDKSLEDTDDLPPPEVLAQEIADGLAAALEQFQSIAAKLRS